MDVLLFWKGKKHVFFQHWKTIVFLKRGGGGSYNHKGGGQELSSKDMTRRLQKTTSYVHSRSFIVVVVAAVLLVVLGTGKIEDGHKKCLSGLVHLQSTQKEHQQ